jgi:hypothetical protein
MVTVDPLGAVLPPVGLWSMTRPLSAGLAVICVWGVTLKPAP